MNHRFEDKLDFFPYGAQYHRAPTPLPEEWPGDLREIARAGYTHIQLRPEWRWHERVRGEPTWDDLDLLFDLAKQYDLRVVLKPMLETAPDWVFSELRGTRIGFHGVPISPIAHGAYYVGGWWPCFDNPEVVEAASEFVQALVERYRDHPALWFYDAWNEPVSRPLGQCQCAHSVALYRDWLKSKFGLIEELNARFGKAWTSYDTLQPPSSAADFAEMFLWRQWAADAVAKQVGFVAQTIRQADPKAFVMVHVGASMVAQDPICATSDDFLNAAQTDRYGTSFFVPLHPKTPVEIAAPDFQSDWLRRVDPMYWCHEFYPNHGEWCVPVEPRTLNRLIWMAIAGGPAGFTFWQYRSERVGCETNGFGLRNIDGSPTPRSEVADAIAQALRRFGARLVGTRREPARVKLLYSRESDMILRLQACKPGIDTITQETWNTEYAYKQAIRRAHALYVWAGEPVDWCVPGDDLSDAPLLHVTCAEMIDATAADWLRSYVRAGGAIIVEFPFACRDERTWVTSARPAHGLEDLIGGIEADRVRLDPERPEIVTFANRDRFPAMGWRIALTVKGGEAVAHWGDGSVAGVRNHFGRGTVIVLGASFSLSFADRLDDPIRHVHRHLLHSLGIERDAGQGEGIWVRRRVGSDHDIWFVFNVSAAKGTVMLPAKPRAVWQDANCDLAGTHLTLAPGATWVGELPSAEASLAGRILGHE